MLGSVEGNAEHTAIRSAKRDFNIKFAAFIGIAKNPKPCDSIKRVIHRATDIVADLQRLNNPFQLGYRYIKTKQSFRILGIRACRQDYAEDAVFSIEFCKKLLNF